MAGKLDFYAILGISHDSTKQEIVKAYRRKALKCHPDKNLNNPKASELFHELSKALEVLTNPSAKAAYDNTLRARKAVEKRHRELDERSKKLKEDLEARERRAKQFKTEEAKLKAERAAEIERIQKEGRLWLLEQELLRHKIHHSRAVVEEDTINVRRNVEKDETKSASACGDVFSARAELRKVFARPERCMTLQEFESYESSVLTKMRLAEERKKLNGERTKVVEESGKSAPV